MQPIAPLTPEGCRPYIGKPVCAVLHDGSEVIGYLHGIEDNRLLIRIAPDSEPVANTARANVKSHKKNKRKTVKTSAFAPFFLPGGLLALELALIAALFLIPFFWW